MIDNSTVHRYNQGEVKKMYLNQLLKEKGISKYKLAKLSGVPQSTIADICSGKTNIKKCTAETLYKISKVLDVTMESLIEKKSVLSSKRTDFEIFKSNVCHLVKDKGDIDFLLDIINSDEIRVLYNKKWIKECVYLLSMVDYLSRINDIPLCSDYSDIRNIKMSEPIYPKSVLIMDEILKTDEHKENSLKNAIPEFLKHNIVEGDIRNVC